MPRIGKLFAVLILAGGLAGPPGVEAGPSSAGLVHEILTVKDGLRVNGLNHVLQSRDGYLWIASFDGLLRFDGRRFVAYTADRENGLPSNRIVRLFESRDGDLWLMTEIGHLVRLDRRTDRFEVTGLVHPSLVRDVWYEDPAGTLWILTRPGVATFGRASHRIVPFASEVLGGLAVEAIFVERDGARWFGTAEKGLIRLGLDGRVSRWTSLDGLASNAVRAVYVDPQNTVWIGTDRGIDQLLDGEIVPWKMEGKPFRDEILSLFEAPSGSVLINARHGVYRLSQGIARKLDDDRWLGARERLAVDSSGQTWVAAKDRLLAGDQKVFSDGSLLTSLAIDHEDNIWVTTGSSGLYRFRRSLVGTLGEAQGLASKNVYGIYEDPRRRLWVGTAQGELYRFQDGRVERIPAGETGGAVSSILEDSRRRLLVGFRPGLFELREGRFLPILPRLAINALYETRRRQLYAGTDRGLFQDDGSAWNPVEEIAQQTQAEIRVIYEDRAGRLYLGTNGDGLLLSRSGDSRGPWTHLRRGDGLPSDQVRCLWQDPRGRLWVGTEDSGIAVVDLDHGLRFEILDRQRGLYSDGIHQMLEDLMGNLWMSSNQGIFRLSLEDVEAVLDGRAQRFRSFAVTERDGMRNREANGGFQNAGFRSQDGRLFFPTQAGVAIIEPAAFLHDLGPPPQVHVESVRVHGHAKRIESSSVALGAEERSFEIDYAAPSFVAPERQRFRYRLAGFESRWTDAGTRQQAFYTNVPPGTYRFQVAGSNGYGVWNERGAELRISIEPFLYETRAFLVVCLVGALAAVAGVVTIRGRQRRRYRKTLERRVEQRTADLAHEKQKADEARATIAAQAAKLRQLDRAKSKLFANLSHEFRTPLTLILGPLDDIREEVPTDLRPAIEPHLKLVRSNAERLLTLINQLLDLAKVDARGLELHCRRANLTDFAREVGGRFAALAEQRGIRFDIRCTAEGDVPLWVDFDADQLDKALSNLLYNAFKFSPEGGSVRLTVEADGAERAFLRVRDNGPGISPADQSRIFDRFFQVESSRSGGELGTGIGLALARELVELHGGAIRVESEEGFGSIFTIDLPAASAPPDEIRDEAPPPETGVVAKASPVPEFGLFQSELGPRSAVEDSIEESEDRTTVLIVEDNAQVLAYLRRHLARHYRVIEAADGNEGLRQARETVPDLIVCDVMLPGQDGFALCRAVKNDPNLDFVPVVLLTAKASPESRLEGLDGGADDYLTKPFDVRELLTRIDNLIRSRRRLLERAGSPALPALLSSSVPAEIPSEEEAFLERLSEVIEERLGDEELTIEDLAGEMGMDRTNLYRRLRSQIGRAPSELLLELRLERAAGLFRRRAGSVSEVAYSVGFKSVSHFGRRFRQRFGVSPSQARRDPSSLR